MQVVDGIQYIKDTSWNVYQLKEDDLRVNPIDQIGAFASQSIPSACVVFETIFVFAENAIKKP